MMKKKPNKSAMSVADKMKSDNGKSSKMPNMGKTLEGSKQGRRTGGNK